MSIRVLIVDPQQLYREMTRFELTVDPGITVVGDAPDGDRAMGLMADVTPDVYLTEVRMPGLCGPLATQRLSDRFPDIKVVCLSEYVDPVFVSAMIGSGAKGYVSKAAAPSELREAVHAAMRGGRPYLCQATLASVVAGFPGFAAKRDQEGLLTDREREVGRLICEGLQTGQIADRMGVDASTVRGFRSSIARKLDVKELHLHGDDDTACRKICNLLVCR